MLHEVLLALSGHPSPLFFDPNEAGSGKSLQDKYPLLSPSEAELLRSVGHLSGLHRKLKHHIKLIATRHHSVIARAVASSLQHTHLTRFQKKILEVESKVLARDSSTVGAYEIVPLAGIVAEFAEWYRRLEWYWTVATFMQLSQKQECSGSALIEKLRADSQTGYEDIEAAAIELSRVAETAWLRQLASWLLHGRLPPYGAHDFFIQTSTASDQSGSAFRKVKALLPEFVTPTNASAMLFVGKTLHQLRQYGGHSKSTASARSAINTDVLSKHSTLLSSLSLPIVPTQLSRAISAIRSSLSKNVLQQLLPLRDTLKLLSCLRQFFLLSRGEFGGNLILEAESRMQNRQLGMGRALQRNAVKAMQGLSVKDAELQQTLMQTWKALARQNDEGDDEVLEFARSHVSLTVPTSMSARPSSSDSMHDMSPPMSPIQFNDLLFPTATSLHLSVGPPLDLLLSSRDLQIYSTINAYLLAIERAQLRLSDMWRCSNSRRISSTSEAKSDFDQRHERELKRTKEMRKTWATCNSAMFLISETAGYFEGEIVKGSSDHFEDWVKRPVATPNIETSQNVPAKKDKGGPTQRDPEAIASGHQAFLASLVYSLLLTDVTYTREMRSLLGNVDALIAFFHRLVNIQQGLDIEHRSEGENNLTQEDERTVALELDRARKKVDSDLRSVITRLRQLDEERIGSLRFLDVRSRDIDEADPFRPWRGGGLERLLVKVDGRAATDEKYDII